MRRMIAAVLVSLVVSGCWETALNVTNSLNLNLDLLDSPEHKGDYRSPYDQSAMTDGEVCRGASYGNPAHEEEVTKRKLECK
jgi:hypothetical protein